MLRPAFHCTNVVELQGIEPWTSSMRTKRATNCATAPNADLSANLGEQYQRPAGSQDTSGAPTQPARNDSPTSTGTLRETFSWAATGTSLP